MAACVAGGASGVAAGANVDGAAVHDTRDSVNSAQPMMGKDHARFGRFGFMCVLPSSMIAAGNTLQRLQHLSASANTQSGDDPQRASDPRGMQRRFQVQTSHHEG
jgi:hypothetical protein